MSFSTTCSKELSEDLLSLSISPSSYSRESGGFSSFSGGSLRRSKLFPTNIGDLPLELLNIIFQFLPVYPVWIRILSRVCHHWNSGVKFLKTNLEVQAPKCSIDLEMLQNICIYSYRLKNLNIHSSQGILTSSLLNVFSSQCRELETLKLSQQQTLLSFSWPALPPANTSSISNAAINYLWSNLEHLKCVNISNSPHITDNGVIHIANDLKKLEQIFIMNCSNLTDELMYHFSLNCKDLKLVSLSDVTIFCSEDMKKLISSLKKLQSIRLSEFPLF